MKGLNITIVLLLASLITGVVSAPFLDFSLRTLILLTATSLVFFIAAHFYLKVKRDQSILTGALAFILFFSFGMLLVYLKDPLNEVNHYSKITKPEESENLILTITEELKPGFYQGKYTARVEQIENKPTSGLVLINIIKDTTSVAKPHLKVDDKIYIKGILENLNPSRHPYQFDYAAYLKQRGIYAQLSVSKQEVFPLGQDQKTLRGYAAKSRSFLKDKLAKFHFQQDSWAVLNALLLGQRQELSTDLQASYINAGVIHILAVSGLHVGILMLIVQFLLKPLGNFKSSTLVRGILIIASIWLFAIFTGLSPSVLRAATMFSFIQIGILLNQRQASLNALIISAFLLILINPELIYEIGFQLSYAAVFFIIWLYPKFDKIWQPENKILKYYWQLISVSIAAQLVVLPLSLYYFHQFPGLFLVANLIVLPAIGILLIYGIVILLLASVNLLPQIAATVYDQLLSWLNSFIRYLSDFEVFLISDIYFSLVLVFIGYAIIFSFGKLLGKVNYNSLYLVLIAFTSLPITLMVLKKQQADSALYILHQYNSSLLVERDFNSNLFFYSTEEQNIPQPIIQNFKRNQLISNIQTDPLRYYFHIKNQKILRLDSLGIYEIPQLKPDYILLTYSPKINLDRLLETFPKAKIISDGSNYRSYVARWAATCRKKKIPFHNTYEKGFYKIN